MRKTTLSRKATLWRLGFFVALVFLLSGAAKCPNVPEMKDVEIILVANEYVELRFEARGITNIWDDTASDTLDTASLREDLEDAGFDLSQIDSAWVTHVTYGVTAYNEGPTDRQITEGEVEVTRVDNATSQVIFTGVTANVYPLLGVLVPAPVEPGAYDYVNEFLADLLWDVQHEVDKEFIVNGRGSGLSVPGDRETDFDWRVRIHFQVVGPATLEIPTI